MTQKDKIKEQVIDKAEVIAKAIVSGKDVMITRVSGLAIKVKELTVKSI